LGEERRVFFIREGGTAHNENWLSCFCI
jgi:hypothetical protein